MTFYSPAARALQDQFDSRRLADRMEEVIIHDALTPDDRAFIEAQDMCFLATVSADGQPTCSYKGGNPGFVHAIDDRTLAMPVYDGNGMFLTMGNASETHRIGLLFINFVQPKRMRVEGRAELRHDDPRQANFPASKFMLYIHIDHVYPNCGRYIHKMERVEQSPFVPDSHGNSPTPGWKNAEWANDALPMSDPARKS